MAGDKAPQQPGGKADGAKQGMQRRKVCCQPKLGFFRQLQIVKANVNFGFAAKAEQGLQQPQSGVDCLIGPTKGYGCLGGILLGYQHIQL